MDTTPKDGAKSDPIEDIRNLTTEIRELLRKQVLGEDDFWSRYDMAADVYDKAQLHRQNDNLDVLLIFAGLFSAVNTAFIVLTIVNLSAPPSYKMEQLLTFLVNRTDPTTLSAEDFNPSFVPHTAAIRQSCLFFASLCSSILAAAGAVLGKQWLRKYERTGQVGSHEAQGRIRTEKWYGSEEWGLRAVIELLPNLLLVSVGLFFAAVADYLWATRKPVAVVVLVFIVVGVLLYAIMVISAAIDKDCPFQTAPSGLLREGIKEMREFSSRNLETEAPEKDSRALRFRRVLEWLPNHLHHDSPRPQDEIADTTPPTHTPLRSRLTSNARSLYAWVIELLPSRRSHAPHVDLESTALSETVGEPAAPAQPEEIEAPAQPEESQEKVAVEAVGDEGAHVEKSSPWAWLKKKVFKGAEGAAASPDEQDKAKGEDPAALPRGSSQTIDLTDMWKEFGAGMTDEEKLFQKTALIDEKISARSIVWMMENATNKTDLLSAADMIPSLTRREATELMAGQKAMTRLIDLFQSSLTVVVDSNATDADDALIFGRAVAHVLLADPASCLETVREALLESQVRSLWTSYWKAQLIQPSLQALCAGMFAMTSENDTVESFPAAAAAAFEEMQRGKVEPTTVVAFSGLLTLSRFGLSGAILEYGIPHSDALFSLVCLEIIERTNGQRSSLADRVRYFWLARDGSGTLGLMSKALQAQSDQIAKGHVRKSLLELHTRLLLAFRQRSIQSYPSGREDFLKAVAGHQVLISHAADDFGPVEDQPVEVGPRVTEQRKPPAKTPGEASTTPSRRWDQLRLITWEDRVKEDPPVPADTLPGEIRAYARQLELLLGDGTEWWLKAAESEVFIDTVKTEANSATVDQMLKEPTFPLADLKKNYSIIPLSSLTPFIEHALGCDVPVVLAATYKLLNAVGEGAWDIASGPRLGRPLVVTPKLGCAVISSLSINARKMDMFYFATSNQFDLEGLLYWLAESVKEDKGLGEAFSSSGAASLFVSTIRNTYKASGGDNNYVWCIAFLFLRTWTTSSDQQKDPAPAEGAREGDTSLQEVCVAFKEYALGTMVRLQNFRTNPDLFRHSATFIEEVYRLRPYLAVGLELDDVRDKLMGASAGWWGETEVIPPNWDAAAKPVPRVVATITEADTEEKWIRTKEINLFLDIAIKYKAESVAMTKAVELSLTNPNFPLVGLLKSDANQPPSSLVLVLICALKSKVFTVFDAAYQLIGELGQRAGSRYGGPRDGKPFVINVELGRSVMQSLSANVVAKAPGFSIVSYAGEHEDNLVGLLYWLSESARHAPELATPIGTSGVTSLFVEGISGAGRKGWASTSSLEDRVMWHLVFLYLSMWAASETRSTGGSAEKTPSLQPYQDGAMSDAVCRTLAWYIHEHMTHTLNDYYPDDQDVLRKTFAFIEQVFLTRPVAGLKFGLDAACEELIRFAAGWNEGLGMDACWKKARNAYPWAGQAHSMDVYNDVSNQDQTFMFSSQPRFGLPSQG
ncbi:hypothetical protein FRB96_001619 [Tulasnella sp. 330]|nr:hypothetical protein FRB96_001619 [Tulasnella sp. 330]